MAKKKSNTIDKRALDVLTEKMESFELESESGKKETLYLYPLQLGRLAIVSRKLLDLDFVFDENHADDSVKQLWTVCAEKPREVAEIIAIATLRTKQDVDANFEQRVNLIMWSPTMTQQALTNVLYTIVMQSYYADFVSAIRSVRTLRVMISQMTPTERIAPTEAAASGE
nr:MAG TPA: hypothetical protein [Bacteriophage sp.]